MEIKPQHLRVGNLIYDHECEPYIFEVEEIKKNNQGVLAVYYRNGSCMATEVEGVALSEDLLVNRFGFVKHKDGFFVKIFDTEEEFTICYYGSVNGSEKGFVANNDFRFKRIKYAHQLQSLFQDLTETELTSK